MTVFEVMGEISQLPNYYYCFHVDGQKHCVILRGHPCKVQDKYMGMEHCDRLLRELQTLYKKKP